MFNSTTLSANAAQSSLELVDILSTNIINSETPGFNSKRFSFHDYLTGGQVEINGNSWRQGKKMVRIGEPTKMMLSGKGLFTTLNPQNNEILYTRLGDFNFDRAGNLATHEGFLVLGTPLVSNVQPQGNSGYKTPGEKYEISTFVDPFSNPTNREYPEVAPGGSLGGPQPVNLAVDPRNGLYLGKYEKIRVDQSGVIWGRYGDSEVSLYKITLTNFQNFNGLKNFRETYWKQTSESGPPLPCTATVFNEAIEKSNVWTKVEVDYMIEAQRQYSAAINAHKVADRLMQQAIELVG
jgi:flagellar hook protein FlgE